MITSEPGELRGVRREFIKSFESSKMAFNISG